MFDWEEFLRSYSEGFGSRQPSYISERLQILGVGEEFDVFVQFICLCVLNFERFCVTRVLAHEYCICFEIYNYMRITFRVCSNGVCVFIYLYGRTLGMGWVADSVKYMSSNSPISLRVLGVCNDLLGSIFRLRV